MEQRQTYVLDLKCVNFHFLKLTLEYIGQYGVMQDNNDQHWTTWDQARPFGTIPDHTIPHTEHTYLCDHVGAFGTMLDRMVQYLTIWDKGPHVNLRIQTGSFGDI